MSGERQAVDDGGASIARPQRHCLRALYTWKKPGKVKVPEFAGAAADKRRSADKETPCERTYLLFMGNSSPLADLPADMAAGIVLGDQQLILQLLPELVDMGDDADQPGSACHLAQHLDGLLSGMIVE